MASFEEAKHQGYSAADIAADYAEQEKRMQELGCFSCQYVGRYAKACHTVREDKNNIYTNCPYRKEA